MKAAFQTAAALLCLGAPRFAAALETPTSPPRTAMRQVSDLHLFERVDADTLRSPILDPRMSWNELVLSWNARGRVVDAVEFLAQGEVDGDWTEPMSLGRWSSGGRTSVSHQSDPDCRVDTDILVMTRPARRFRILARGAGSAVELDRRLEAVFVSLLRSDAPPSERPPLRTAWGRSLPVPEKSQLWHEDGGAWCSPTSVAMTLEFWSRALQRDDLRVAVPEVAAAVHDPAWGGTGNWSFNVAFAGSFDNMTAYVARLRDIRDIEAWIAADTPVVASVCLNRLRGRSGRVSGHLVVVAGFDAEGHPILCDPGTAKQIRWTPKRADFLAAWNLSRRTAYLIHPKGRATPSTPHSLRGVSPATP